MVNEGWYVQCCFTIISLGNNLRSLILLQSMASTRGGRCLQAPSFAACGGWSLEGWMERVCCKLLNTLPVEWKKLFACLMLPRGEHG